MVIDTGVDSLPEQPPSPQLPIAPIALGRGARKRRLPRAYKDFLPSSTSGLPEHIPRPQRAPKRTEAHPEASSYPEPTQIPPDPDTANPPETPPDHVVSSTPEPVVGLRTEPNSFGLFRVYEYRPSHDPDEETELSDLADSLTFLSTRPKDRNPLKVFGRSVAENVQQNIFHPFLNITVFLLMSWFYSGSNLKSFGELDRLVHNVILQEEFKPQDLINFNSAREAARLDAQDDKVNNPFPEEDGWHEAKVNIQVPFRGSKWPREQDAPTFSVEGLHYRKLTHVIRSVCEDPSARRFHWIPHDLFVRWSDDPDDTERVYSEAFNTDKMKEIVEEIKGIARNPNDSDDVEYAPFPLGIYSDATLLANFGIQTLHPFYLWAMQQSKYERAKPSTFSAQHLAYIPKVSSQCLFCRITCTNGTSSYQIHFKNGMPQPLASQQLQMCFVFVTESSYKPYGFFFSTPSS